MGFFGDMADMVKLGREWQDTVDVKSRMADAQGRLDALAASMAPPATSPEIEARRVAASATVQGAAQTPTWVNGQPVIRIDLLVELPSGIPLPVQISTIVPQLHLTRVQPGATVAVSLDPATPASLRIEWDTIS